MYKCTILALAYFFDCSSACIFGACLYILLKWYIYSMRLQHEMAVLDG